MSNAFNLGNRYAINTYNSGTNPNLNIHYKLSQHQKTLGKVNNYLMVISTGINIVDDLYKDHQAGTGGVNSYTNFMLNLAEPGLVYGAGAVTFVVSGIFGWSAIVPVAATLIVSGIISGVTNEMQEAIRNVDVEKHVKETLDFYNRNESYFKELEKSYGYDLKPFKDKTGLLDNNRKNNQPSYSLPFY